MTIFICPSCGKLVPQGHRCQPPAVPPIGARELAPAEASSPAREARSTVTDSQARSPQGPDDNEATASEASSSTRAERREKKREQTRLRVRRLRERRRLAAAAGSEGGGT